MFSISFVVYIYIIHLHVFKSKNPKLKVGGNLHSLADWKLKKSVSPIKCVQNKQY